MQNYFPPPACMLSAMDECIRRDIQRVDVERPGHLCPLIYHQENLQEQGSSGVLESVMNVHCTDNMCISADCPYTSQVCWQGCERAVSGAARGCCRLLLPRQRP